MVRAGEEDVALDVDGGPPAFEGREVPLERGEADLRAASAGGSRAFSKATQPSFQGFSSEHATDAATSSRCAPTVPTPP